MDTTIILSELSKQLEPAVKAILEMDGVKSSSDLIKSIEFQSDDQVVNFIVNDYFEYLSNGRRPGARKIPIEFIIEFIKKNNIMPKPKETINQLAFAIMTSIYKQGIIGKNYLDQVIATMGDLSQNKVADDLGEQIADEITLDLTQN